MESMTFRNQYLSEHRTYDEDNKAEQRNRTWTITSGILDGLVMQAADLHWGTAEEWGKEPNPKQLTFG